MQKLAKELSIGDAIQRPTHLNPLGAQIIDIETDRDKLIITASGQDGDYQIILNGDDKIRVW